MDAVEGTSCGNVFCAGIIDLEVDCAGDTVFSAQDDPLPPIFEYLPCSDIKPGYSGEVTLSLHLKRAATPPTCGYRWPTSTPAKSHPR